MRFGDIRDYDFFVYDGHRYMKVPPTIEPGAFFIAYNAVENYGRENERHVWLEDYIEVTRDG